MSENLKIPEGLNPAAYAVADAMMIAQAHFMRDVPRTEEYFQAIDNAGVSMDTLLKNTSVDACSEACTVVLTYLASEHIDKFVGMAYLTAYGAVSDLWNSRISFHDNFLVRDTYGVWYAGSPANYEVGGRHNRMTNIFSDTNLQNILDGIREQDFGRWPKADFIEKVFQEHPYRLPIVNTENSKLTSIEINKLDDYNHDGNQNVKLTPLAQYIDGKFVFEK